MKTDEVQVIQDLLGLVSFQASVKEIKSWSENKREKIIKWAAKTHYRAADNNVRVPKKPSFKGKIIGIKNCFPGSDI